MIRGAEIERGEEEHQPHVARGDAPKDRGPILASDIEQGSEREPGEQDRRMNPVSGPLSGSRIRAPKPTTTAATIVRH